MQVAALAIDKRKWQLTKETSCNLVAFMFYYCCGFYVAGFLHSVNELELKGFFSSAKADKHISLFCVVRCIELHSGNGNQYGVVCAFMGKLSSRMPS